MEYIHDRVYLSFIVIFLSLKKLLETNLNNMIKNHHNYNVDWPMSSALSSTESLLNSHFVGLAS